MSSYLLLRNNKESGPFTIEEIKGLSLKSYDLIWVVGKSAAWRYPGEITELKSFAPAIPEPFSDLVQKKTNSLNLPQENNPAKKSEQNLSRAKENGSKQANTAGSVYVNLPAEKKTVNISNTRIIADVDPEPKRYSDPAYDFADLYKKQPSRTARISGKILWISTVLLLFGTGILTGLFISDRRKYFTIDANHPQSHPAVQPAVTNKQKEISSPVRESAQQPVNSLLPIVSVDSVKQDVLLTQKMNNNGKKKIKNNGIKKDTVAAQLPSYSTINLTDSTIKQNTVSKNDLLYQKIKAHPENYVSLVTGRYNTGLFGGISSFPVSITNNSPVMLDLVVVNIEYIQNNDKIYKTESLSFNDLEPGETVSLKAPKSSRGIKIATRIHIVNAKQLGLTYSN